MLSGNLPAVRIAARAGNAASPNLTAVVQTGPSTTLTAYGSVVTVSAIIGTGMRTGAAMPWGPAASFAHVGLDLTGPNGGQVRIDAIKVKDVTGVCLHKMMDWVDVADYGARGDGLRDGPRTAALVLCDNNIKTMFEGDHVDNCFIGRGTIATRTLPFPQGFSFHALTLDGNIYFSTESAPWMNLIVVKPCGPDHFISGLKVTGNLFKKTGAAQRDAVDGVDTSFATLDLTRTADLLFSGNTYKGLVKRTENPVTVRHVQGVAAAPPPPSSPRGRCTTSRT